MRGEGHEETVQGPERQDAGGRLRIANYFALDPTLVRLLWVVFTAMGSAGIAAYIVCVLVIPEEPER